jgi:hypothetical protein
LTKAALPPLASGPGAVCGIRIILFEEDVYQAVVEENTHQQEDPREDQQEDPLEDQEVQVAKLQELEDHNANIQILESEDTLSLAALCAPKSL